MGGLQTDSTWDMMWRLYSRTFGPQKVGKTNILINGAYPILRLMHETAKTLTDYDTETSKTRKIGGELARFASGRANPLMSDIVQLLLGRDYMGEPYGPMIFPKLFESQFAKEEKKVTWGDVGQGMVNMTINTLVPLAQRDLIETTADVAEEFGIFGLMAAPVTMSLAMMGWAKSTYPVSHTRQRFEVEKIMRDYERIKKEGTREQQAEYRERYGWVVRNEKGFKSTSSGCVMPRAGTRTRSGKPGATSTTTISRRPSAVAWARCGRDYISLISRFAIHSATLTVTAFPRSCNVARPTGLPPSLRETL